MVTSTWYVVQWKRHWRRPARSRSVEGQRVHLLWWYRDDDRSVRLLVRPLKASSVGPRQHSFSGCFSGKVCWQVLSLSQACACLLSFDPILTAFWQQPASVYSSVPFIQYRIPPFHSTWDPNSRMSTLLVSENSHPFNHLAHLWFTIQRSARQKQSVFDRNIRIVFRSALRYTAISRNICTHFCGIIVGYLWEGRQNRHPHHRQEEILGTFCGFLFIPYSTSPLKRIRAGSNCWPVRVRNPQTNQVGPREGHLHFRWWSITTYGCPHECHIRGT